MQRGAERNRGRVSSDDSPPEATWVPGPIIIGAGPSGLAAAACLANVGIPSTVVEKSSCVGSLWQHRTYDRLRLHLPKQFCELPMLGFPEGFPKYPSKHQFLSYLEAYAAAFGIRPRFRTEVAAAEFDPAIGAWRVRTRGGGELASRWLVVATGENAEPLVPEFPGMTRFLGRVVHTCAYKSGADFVGQRVLVVGCGNSGMEVSLDLCRHGAKPHMVVRNTVHVLPREMMRMSTFGLTVALLRWLPLRLVDQFLCAVAHLMLGDTDRLGLRRPKTGPIALKNLTGKTPVLDAGALAQIKSGNIKVTRGVKEITPRGAKFIDGTEYDENNKRDVGVLDKEYKSKDAGVKKFIVDHFMVYKMVDVKEETLVINDDEGGAKACSAQ
ncbi:indole-3-pyruvate monooxygenase YUCCA1-like [Curcuma longa]|uniref:indole-3-pyruvate monooxygenase YUCCA1-like n=1 Tax=Curcuma longa TaxID=136217 RepID=UPI003D9EFFA8